MNDITYAYSFRLSSFIKLLFNIQVSILHYIHVYVCDRTETYVKLENSSGRLNVVFHCDIEKLGFFSVYVLYIQSYVLSNRITN